MSAPTTDRCPAASDGEHLWAETGAVDMMADHVCLGCGATATSSPMDPPVSFRIRWRQYSPAHVEARVYCSEFGPDSSHAYSGSLRFRTGEWAALRQLLALYPPDAYAETHPDAPVLQIIEDENT